MLFFPSYPCFYLHKHKGCKERGIFMQTDYTCLIPSAFWKKGQPRQLFAL